MALCPRALLLVRPLAAWASSTNSHPAARECAPKQHSQRHHSARQYSTAPDYVVKSSVPEMDFQKGNFVEYLFQDTANMSGDMAMSCTSTGVEYSFGALRDMVGRWGGYLQRQGLDGAVVAVVAPDTAYSPAVMYGTIGAGGVYAGINYTYTAEEIAHLLADNGAKLVVAYGPLEPVVRQAMEINKQELPIVSIGPSSPGNLPRAENILVDPTIGFADLKKVSGTETMTILYTSGTTGRPKGTAISHNAAIANITMMRHPRFFASASHSPATPKSWLQMLPTFHVSGFLAISAMATRAGIKLYNIGRFDPSNFLQHVSNSKVTLFHALPNILNFALARPEFCKKNFDHLEGVIVGGASVPSSTVKALQERMGEDFIIQQTYGMTEILLTHQDPVGVTRAGYTGQLLPTTVGKVLDLGTGLPLPAYKNGELCFKNSCIMIHYLNKEEATRSTVDKDGWLHTGDIGHYDDDGYFCVVDRTKEMIEVNTLQVSPSEIEDVILAIPEVVEVSVVGVPHDRYGEAPMAYVVTDTPITAEKVHEHMKANAAKYKQLAGGLVFVPQLPKNAVGKVMRKDLVKLALEGK